MSIPLPVSEDFVKRVAQTYEGLEENVLRMLGCMLRMEVAIANHYSAVSERLQKHSEQLRLIVDESYHHAGTYSKLIQKLTPHIRPDNVSCGPFESYLSKISHVKHEGNLNELIMLQEELVIKVLTQLIHETCKLVLEDVSEIRKIIEDETKHWEILRKY